MLKRLPIESSGPLLVFAWVRVGLTTIALVATIVLDFPYESRLASALGAGVLWSVAVLVLTSRRPDLAQSPMVAVGDVALLSAVNVIAPETYGAVRFTALFLVAVHAHFQGERIGVLVAVLTSVALVGAHAARSEAGKIHGDLLAFYEIAFVAATVATGLIVGRLRTTESASRLRARGLTRRTLKGEGEVRRRVAEALHDGPVQDLIGMDMMISAANRAVERGDTDRLPGLLAEAREVVERSVQVLRDEIVDLGPYAFEELTLEVALDKCLELWQRRYGMDVRMSVERLGLEPETAEELFRIAQEAVANAGRHSGAERIEITVRSVGRQVELRVADNGRGFSSQDPLADGEPGHIGLASMRERAEIIGGTLRIDTSERGTRVLVLAPLD